MDSSDNLKQAAGEVEEIKADTSLEADAEESGTPRTIKLPGGEKLEEKLCVEDAYVFTAEELVPIFCKPKLIPLKTTSMIKLDQIKKEKMEKLNVSETEPGPSEPPKDKDSGESGQSTSETDETKNVNVWVAID